VALGALLTLLTSAAAMAGTATRVGTVITVEMGNQDGNAASVLRFFATGPDFATTSATIINSGEGNLIAGPGCDQSGANKVFCGFYPTVTSLTMSAGGGNDTLEVLTAFGHPSPPATSLFGGTGADTLIGGDGPSNLDGGPGDDAVGGYVRSTGGRLEAGDDTLRGRAGDDVLVGGEGDDSLDGGPGNDTAFYSAPGRGAPNSPLRAVRASLAAGTATGVGTDTLANLENLTGTVKNDVLIGDGGANRLKGGFGKDRLFGGAGGDLLFGGQKADRLRGGAGGDELFARDRRRDRVGGGPGRDVGHVDPIDRVFGVEVF
jgi:Ca2+-binding RTX toxin-like protein